MKLETLSSLEPEARTLLPSFLQSGRERLVRLEALLARQEFGEIRRLGHGLKGSGAMYELGSFQNLGLLIENAADTRDAASLVSLYRDLNALLDELATALARENTPP